MTRIIMIRILAVAITGHDNDLTTTPVTKIQGSTMHGDDKDYDDEDDDENVDDGDDYNVDAMMTMPLTMTMTMMIMIIMTTGMIMTV